MKCSAVFLNSSSQKHLWWLHILQGKNVAIPQEKSRKRFSRNGRNEILSSTLNNSQPAGFCHLSLFCQVKKFQFSFAQWNIFFFGRRKTSNDSYPASKMQDNSVFFQSKDYFLLVFISFICAFIPFTATVLSFLSLCVVISAHHRQTAEESWFIHQRDRNEPVIVPANLPHTWAFRDPFTCWALRVDATSLFRPDWA